MKNLVGFRLREGRLRKNMSQEGLCRGICAVSYLSKIEQGRAEPGPDIVRLLFARLGVSYEDDPLFLQESRALLHTLFEKHFREEDCAAEEEELWRRGPRLLQSPLCLTYWLARAFRGQEPEEAYAALTPYAEYMDDDVRFLYELLRAHLTPFEEGMQALRRAESLNPCSRVSYTAAGLLFGSGKYQEALRCCTQGYTRAAGEGCIPMMREISFLEALCYANLFQHTLMLRAFDRTSALSQGDPEMLTRIDYNIGASFLEKGRFAEALPRLLDAERRYRDPTMHTGKDSRCMVFHKLAICCRELSHQEEARKWLAQAQSELPGLPEIYGRMLRLIELRLLPQYNLNDEYFTLLQSLCAELGDALHHGYRQFHALFLMEALVARRRYREAYLLARELNPMFSQE